MNNELSNEHMADMHLILGKCDGNASAAARLYAIRFPNRIHPKRRMFLSIHRRLRETGSFKNTRAGVAGRPRSARTVEQEAMLLDEVTENPEISCRRLSNVTGTSKNTIFRTFREQQLRPYHFTKVHALEAHDHNARIGYSNWLINQINLDHHFVNKILFTDEAIFTRNGIQNLRNAHNWSDENPRVSKVTHFQRNFSVNVWAGIVDDYLIGPFFLPNRLTGELFLNFLTNNFEELLDDVNINIRTNMWFQLDGAPPHYSRLVRNHLNTIFPNRWIGRGNDAPVNWPARSPDLTPLDFCFWGYMKDKVYSVQIDSVDQLRQRIVQAAQDFQQTEGIFQRVRFSCLKRARMCIQNNGENFEHLMN